MESVRPYYEYPPSHAAIVSVPRDYGSVTPAKARRSWGDILKFGMKGKKDRDLSPVTSVSPQPTAIVPAGRSYLTEYREKYGALNSSHAGVGVAAQGSYRTSSYSSSSTSYNGRGTVSAASGATMASTVRYTDWFGSVTARRPPLRPPLPSFNAAPLPVPTAFVPVHEKPKHAGTVSKASSSWDHYVTLENPNYEAPQYVPVQLYTNVCMCPENLQQTRSRKKKKCKNCGRKPATTRNTTGSKAKMRPGLVPGLYQPPPVATVPPPQSAVPMNPYGSSWGWQIMEEHIYEQFEYKTARHRSKSRSPTRVINEEDDSPPPTPETVRSVRSIRSVRSNGSTVTLTNKTAEPLRPAPPPPVLSLPPPQTSTSSFTGKDAGDPSSTPSKRSPTSSPSSHSAPTTPVGTAPSSRIVINSKGDNTSQSSPGKKLTHRHSANIEYLLRDESNKRRSILDEDVSAYELISRYAKEPEDRDGLTQVRLPSQTKGKTRLSVDSSNKCIITVNGDASLSSNSSSSSSALPLSTNTSSGLSTTTTDNGHAEDETDDDVSSLHDTTDLQQGGRTVRIAGQRMLVRPSGQSAESEGRSGFSSDEEESDYPASTARDSDTDDTLPEEEEEDFPFYDDEDRNSKRESRSEELLQNDSLNDQTQQSVDRLIQEQQQSYSPSLGSSMDRWSRRSCPTRETIYEEEEEHENERPVNQDEDDEDKDTNSISSSSTCPSSRRENFPPTLSPLLKVKSILKKPGSLDTSSETDSDFYLPTFPEYKQNQRKKKQVHFLPSHDVTVLDDEGENRGYSRGPKRNRDRNKNNHNLFLDLQDIYSRSNQNVTFRAQLKTDDSISCEGRTRSNDNMNNDRDSDINLDNNSSVRFSMENINVTNNNDNRYSDNNCDESSYDQCYGLVDPRLDYQPSPDYDDTGLEDDDPTLEGDPSRPNDNRVVSDVNGSGTRRSEDSTETLGDHRGSAASLRRSLSEPQTNGPSSPVFNDTLRQRLSNTSSLPTLPSTTSPHFPSKSATSPFGIISTSTTPVGSASQSSGSQARQQSNRNRTLSPTRPNVPPPPPPVTKTNSSTSSPSATSSQAPPFSRPLPTLPLSPPAEAPPPPLSSSSSQPPPSPPPPLPTSPPPPLEESGQMVPSLWQTQDSLPSPFGFSSFKGEGVVSTASPPTTPTASQELTMWGLDRLQGALPLSPVNPFFNENEEQRTATIRTSAARVSNMSKHVSAGQPQSSSRGSKLENGSSSGAPVAPQRRNRNRSLSPEDSTLQNDSYRAQDMSIYQPKSPVNSRKRNGQEISEKKRPSILGLIGEENPYEQIGEHIYEELVSQPPNSSHHDGRHKSPSPGKSMFEGASKNEILEYLQDARLRVALDPDQEQEDDEQEEDDVTEPALAPLDPVEDLVDDEGEDQVGLEPPEDNFTVLALRNRGPRSSNMSSNSDSSENSALLRSDKERLIIAEVERTDSGVGSETSKPSLGLRRVTRTANREGDHVCDDCDVHVDATVTSSGVMYAPLVCRRCGRRRQERKEILMEIIETEVKYGRDLKVIVEEFFKPMEVAGLLTRDQLRSIFLNVEELLEHNRQFTLQLRDALEIALDQGDEDLLTVNIAKLFLQAVPMLHAFENYCVRQGEASLLLQGLEKERELLRIFLKVSQMENTLLRRMNLHSFLMVPVQRVTKYPLLLARLYKTTPPTHPSREDCRRAKDKIEVHLQHMNNETKEISPTKLWRRISMSVGSSTPLRRVPPTDHTTNLKLRKVALEVLEWSSEDVQFSREGRLLCLTPDSNNWTRRGRSIKMIPVHVVLVTLGKPRQSLEECVTEDGLVTPRDLGLREAALLVFKDTKVSKSALIRDPFMLSRCVLAWEVEGEECFELAELSGKDTFIFKSNDTAWTEGWFRHLQFIALAVGSWKRRRPALANIMINGMQRS